MSTLISPATAARLAVAAMGKPDSYGQHWFRQYYLGRGARESYYRAHWRVRALRSPYWHGGGTRRPYRGEMAH